MNTSQVLQTLRAWRTGPCLVLIGLFAAFPFVLDACNVPVFRYALEHWSPDLYRGTIFHTGELSDADRQLIADLSQSTDSRRVNLQMRVVSVDDIENPADRALLAACDPQSGPCLVLQYPTYLRLDHPVWSGAWNANVLAELTDSPARREVLKRLVAGESAVWVLLESGHAEQDAQAQRVLASELKRLQATLKLPELTDAPEDVLLGGPDLRITFSTLSLQRDDPAEAGLIATLLAAEDDLAELQEPLVFPVFGRGRALLPLVGAGITSENIRSSATFLVGACSCQVKELNPGFDLLVTADWQELVPWTKTPATSLGAVDVAKPELVPIPQGTRQMTSTTDAATLQTERVAEAVTGVVAPSAAATDVPAERTDPFKELLLFPLGLIALAGLAAALVIGRSSRPR